MAETIIVLVIIGVGLVSTVLPAALVGGIFLWARDAQRRRRRVWADIAHELGLVAAGDSIYGLLEGQQVHLRVEKRGKSSQTVAAGILSLPLDLGLDIGWQAPWDDLLPGVGGPIDVRTGDPSFDPVFLVRADEARRAQALLTPALREGLVRAGSRVRLTDLGVALSQPGIVSDPAALRWMLRSAARLTTLTDDARRHVPAAAPLEPYRPAWKQLALDAGLNRTRAPLGVWGMVEGSPTCIYAARTGRFTYALEISVRFEGPLGVDLRIKPPGAIDEIFALLGGQDRRLGDPAFDRAFTVRCARPDRLPIILDAEARQRLLELAQRAGAVRVVDEGVTVRCPTLALDPRSILHLATSLRDVAARLEHNARSGQDRRLGPYR